MNIKQGYKQTEIGIIPEDWEVETLKNIAYFTNGKAHEQFINETGNYIVINSKFVSTEGKVFKKSVSALALLETGDIAMVMSDIPNGKALAKCFFVDENNKYTLNQRICSIKSSICNNIFLFWKLNRNKYFLAFDSGSGQTNLKKKEVLDCPIAIPPTIEEQTAIANILSDMDAEISQLEGRRAKMGELKQGMMQELLTGRIRLI
ncbi:MAG: restriction endonuclease subunit S [Methylococcales bacterium]|nr:restriction endonuclease subunit S [Methylococcales bacterium]